VTNRIIVLAPHAFLPPKDGADRRAWHLFEAMAAGGLSATFIARTAVVLSGAPPVPHSPNLSWRDHKDIAALAALVTGKDYWELKMLRPGVWRALNQAIVTPFDTVMVNFLYATPLLKRIPKPYRLLVDTHNYDPGCFKALAEAASNPILRVLCRRAAANSVRVLAKLPMGTVMVHVSQRDADLYRRHRPDLNHVVVENGTSIKPRSQAPDYAAGKKRALMFVGSLSAKMNQDALAHFARHFWPRLRKIAEFRVVGSLPPNQVRSLCSQEGWKLFESVSDEQLDRLYEQAHFAVLPFAYGEGSKLKLLEACGHGVPVIATSAGAVGVLHLPSMVTVSDEVDAWSARIACREQLTEQAVTESLRFASNYTWENLAAKMINLVRLSEPIEL